MEVNVIANDIKYGEKGSTCNCPIARAVSRATGATSVAVNGSTISYNGRTVETPENARRFIRRFDAGEYVTPISLEL